MLKTERGTPNMRTRVKRAARKAENIRSHLKTRTLPLRCLHVYYERGHWWVACPTGAQWSVVDAKPGIDGFAFERVQGKA